MKKTLVATLLGLAVASSYGQGIIQFDNYFNAFAQGSQQFVNYANDGALGALSGMTVGSDISVELYYALGTVGSFASLTAIPTSTVAIGGGNPTLPGDPTWGGQFAAGTITIPGWATGQSVTFGYTAFNAGHTITGQSGLWVEPATSMAPIGGVALEMVNGPLGATVDLQVPEPSTLALAGLGAAMLIIRRRK
jgi:hypothetical protein